MGKHWQVGLVAGKTMFMIGNVKIYSEGSTPVLPTQLGGRFAICTLIQHNVMQLYANSIRDKMYNTLSY